MTKYITLIGAEHRTAINSLWAVLKQGRFKLDELFLVLEEEKELLDELKKDFQQLLENYSVNSSVESISDIQNIHRLMKNSDNNSVALDISAASKYSTAKVFMDEEADVFDHVFYLVVDDEKKKTKPLPMIEGNQVKLLDLKSNLEEEI